MWIYFSIFFILLVVAIIDSTFLIKDKFKNIRILIIVLLTVFLIFFAGLRKLGVGVDDFNYYNIFLLAKKGILHKELAFYILSQLFNSILPIFFIYALLGVSIKVLYITKSLYFWGFALFFYFSSYYLLHEMVQIRAGVASALGLLSLYYAGERNFKIFSLLILIGLFFHYSILIFFPIFFLKRKDTRFFYLLLFIISILTVYKPFISASLITSVFPSFINERLLVFLNTGKTINYLNPVIIINYVIIIFILIYWNIFVYYSKQSVFIIKSYIIAVCIQFVFSQFSGISFRLYELLMIVQIPLFDMFLRVLKPKIFVYLFITLYSFLIIYLSVWYKPIVLSYLR